MEMSISKLSAGKISISILLIYMSLTGLFSGVKLFSSHHLISGIIVVTYGITGFAAAAGIVLSSSWAFCVSAIWSETLLLRLFNAQYLVQKDNTMLTSKFVLTITIFCLLIVFLLYYVNKTTRAYCFCSILSIDSKKSRKSLSNYLVTKNIIYAFVLFLIIDFLAFLATIIFITQDFLAIVAINCLLIWIPNLIISKYLISPISRRTISCYYWIISFIILVFLIIPFGTFGVPIMYEIFKRLAM